jgi:DNA-binding MarR family transcriptional regulator
MPEKFETEIDPQDEPEIVADQLHSLAIHLLRKLRREDEGSGLNAPRLSALSVIVFGGPITLGDLAAAEQVRPPTMTRIVNALEELGLVSRTRDATDGRSSQIAATPDGKQLLMEGRERRVRALARQIALLASEDQTALLKATEILKSVVRAI